MVTLETPYGKFEGDTVKDAQKLARKAEREGKKQEEIRAAKRTLARMRAEAQAFRIMRAKMTREDGLPRRWNFAVGGTQYREVSVTGGEDYYADQTLTVGTEDGRGSHGIYGARFVGDVCAGSGYTIAVVLRERGDDKDTVYAVGTNEGELVLESLPTVTLADFRTHGESPEEYVARIGVKAK